MKLKGSQDIYFRNITGFDNLLKFSKSNKSWQFHFLMLMGVLYYRILKEETEERENEETSWG
jgi:hypothetical protein